MSPSKLEAHVIFLFFADHQCYQMTGEKYITKKNNLFYFHPKSLAFGLLLPAYKSYKTTKSDNGIAYVRVDKDNSFEYLKK